MLTGAGVVGAGAAAVSDDDATVAGATYDAATGKGTPLTWRC